MIRLQLIIYFKVWVSVVYTLVTTESLQRQTCQLCKSNKFNCIKGLKLNRSIISVVTEQ